MEIRNGIQKDMSNQRVYDVDCFESGFRYAHIQNNQYY